MKKIFGILPLFLLSTVFGDVHYTNTKSELPQDSKELYLDLMKKVIANTIYEDPSLNGPYNPEERENGLAHPTVAHTMIGMKRLNNIQYCLEKVLEENIPGDCIETGVWRGGATILMRAILQAYGDTERKVWVADSFAGIPASNPEKYPIDGGLRLETMENLIVPLETVQENFAKYGLLDNQVVFLRGWFSETLPSAPIEKLALLRLDGDLYESTMDALINLYPKLSVGGYILIDDYGAMVQCEQAVQDYRIKHGITEPIQWIDKSGVFWKKVR